MIDLDMLKDWPQGGQGQCQEKWRAESGGLWADTGRTTKGNGGGRTADGEKFLLLFSNTQFYLHFNL